MVHGGRKEDTTEVTQHTQWVGETDQQAKPVAAQSTALMRTRDSFPDLSCVCVCVCVCVTLQKEKIRETTMENPYQHFPLEDFGKYIKQAMKFEKRL